jgi:hypothetical protein
MNKAQELFDVLNHYYTDLPNAQIGYLQTIIRGLADNCPIGDELLEGHIKWMKQCEREMAAYREESVAG